MKDIKIADKCIGNNKPVFIIAEAGINHNGKLYLAKEMVKKAKESGADAVKFQAFKAGSLCSRHSRYFSLFKSLEFDKKAWKEISGFADKTGIIFFAASFDEESTEMLDELAVPVFKIASGDLTHLPLIKYIAAKGKPVILSTGMSVLKEVREAVNAINVTGNKEIILLHCVATYPADLKDMNLLAIKTLEREFDLPAGFSDHSIGLFVPSICASLGARVIEKHFTLDKRLSGPDHKLSLEPQEFKQMANRIRKIELALGDGIKRFRPCEEEMRRIARRSVVAGRPIAKGRIITRSMLKISRPGTGIAPKFIGTLVGRKAKIDISQDEVLTRHNV